MKNIIKSFIFLEFLFLMISPAFAENSSQELYDAGQEAFNQGDIYKASDLYQRAIEADPDFAAAYSGLGNAYLSNNGEMSDIIWLFEQAATLEPENAEHYTDLCRAYFQFKENDLAEAACLKSLELTPGSGSAELTLAWVYLLGKIQPNDAIYYFNEVLKKTQSPKIYLGLGMAYARNNENDHVLEIVTLLRSKGEESLARQLEKMIRSSGEIPQAAPRVMPSAPSKIVKGTPPEPMEEKPASRNIGTQKIQLRGKITMLPREETGNSSAAAPVEEPQYGVGAHESTVQERMAKVRKMMGNRTSGHANGTANFSTSGSATGTVQVTAPQPTTP